MFGCKAGEGGREKEGVLTSDLLEALHIFLKKRIKK